MMNLLRPFSAALVLESFVATGIATTLIPDREARLSARLRVNRRLAKLLARCIGLKIATVPKDIRPRGRWGRLILANHLSILDVIALATLEDAIFVTSQEMGEAFGIGSLARFGGAAFVERRHRDQRSRELDTLEAHLANGRTIVLFPEATSGDGESILRFRNGLLRAAKNIPRVEILPVCLHYTKIGGQPVTLSNRERLFLFGEMSVIQQLWRIFTNPDVELTVQYLTPFFAGECQDPVEIATRAELLVMDAFQPLTPGH